MATKRKTPLRPSRDDDFPDDADMDRTDDGPEDDDELESLIGSGARRPASGRGGGRGARSLPHDWADFDYGDADNDWR